MLVTTQWMAEKYQEYNDKYWGGKLPDIAFDVNNARVKWGQAWYTYHYSYQYGKKVITQIKPAKITLSNYYDSPEKVKETTMLHEMIHIADYTFHPEHYMNNRRKYDCHGPIFFQPEARRLAKDGWDIEKYVTAEEKGLSQLSLYNADRLQAKANKGCAICIATDKENGKLWFFKTKISLIGYMDDYIMKTWGDYAYDNFSKIDWYTTNSLDFAKVRAKLKSPLFNGFNTSFLPKLSDMIKTGEMKLVRSHDLNSEIRNNESPSLSKIISDNAELIWTNIFRIMMDSRRSYELLDQLENDMGYNFNLELKDRTLIVVIVPWKKEIGVYIDEDGYTICRIWINPKAIQTLLDKLSQRTAIAIKNFVINQLKNMPTLNENKYQKLKNFIKEIIKEEINLGNNDDPIKNLTGLTNVSVDKISDYEGEVGIE